MKILVLGASGIIGQHLRLCIPQGVEVIFARKSADALHVGVDLVAPGALAKLLQAERPNAIINLAGESRPDIVEKDPEQFHFINAVIPGELARWCQRNNAHYVHVSTQAVFNGERPPYHPKSQRLPVNEYGRQKIEAEQRVEQVGSGWTIARPTFVLGVRPMPAIGRKNPIEQMLFKGHQRQVADRWFSPAFAFDVARELWEIATHEPQMRAVHIGIGAPVSRYDLAQQISLVYSSAEVAAVCHDEFPGLAPRPVDTTYACKENVSACPGALRAGTEECITRWQDLEMLSEAQRAREISIFTGISATQCEERLAQGFGPLHNAVAEDFRKSAPKDEAELLDWYRQTDAYIWELSAYHCDPGFNYAGMCRGIGQRLKTAGVKSVLCLGDGIGDLTLSLHRMGFEAAYHDLFGSKTSKFALSRFLMYTGQVLPYDMTADWKPDFADEYDAIVSIDFLEHVTDVPAWTAAIKDSLKPDGLFFAQNAFACGSGPEGSIPMHLARNDRFEKEWDPLLTTQGFTQESSNWYRRAA